MNQPRLIALQEYRPLRFDREALPERVAEVLWRQYAAQVAVEFPSPRTDGQWQLTAQGWVGHLPVTDEVHLVLQPKVPVGNLFRMLEYAYGLKSFRFLEGLASYATLEDVVERLAHVLARRVLDRIRKGLYHTYLPRTDRLPYIRERLDVSRMARTPGQIAPHCHYHLYTADIDDNRILAWTLRQLMRSGLRREEVRTAVRQAHRALQGTVTATPVAASDCTGRRYSRLNEDYQVLHALCRFFLEHTGPDLQPGRHEMLPFLVNMERLFESFVAAWLDRHRPEHLRFRPQERVSFNNGTFFLLDLVLYETSPGGALGTARCVLDTKYKDASRPAPEDVAQVVAYAVAKGCREAVLAYPVPPTVPLDEEIGRVRVRSLAFPLDADLEAAGQAFLKDLLLKDVLSAQSRLL